MCGVDGKKEERMGGFVNWGEMKGRERWGPAALDSSGPRVSQSRGREGSGEDGGGGGGRRPRLGAPAAWSPAGVSLPPLPQRGRIRRPLLPSSGSMQHCSPARGKGASRLSTGPAPPRAPPRPRVFPSNRPPHQGPESCSARAANLSISWAGIAAGERNRLRGLFLKRFSLPSSVKKDNEVRWEKEMV